VTGPNDHYQEILQARRAFDRLEQRPAPLPPPTEIFGTYFPAHDAENGVYTLDGLQSLFNRRRKLIAAVFLTGLAATLTFVLLLPRKYEAELRLFVKHERVDASATVAPTRPEVTESEVSAEIELFRNRELLEKTVDMCGLALRPASTPQAGNVLVAEAVQELDRELKVSPVKKTNLISVKYAAKRPELAAQVVNTATDLYLEKHMAVHRNQGTSGFFSRQAEYYKQALTKAQKQLSAFQSGHEISLLEQQKQTNLTRIATLEATLQETDSQIRDTERRTALLREQQNSLPVTIRSQSRTARNEQLMEKLKSLLVDLENKRTELLTKYDPSYRLVQEVEKQIRDTRATLEREQAPTVVDQTEAVNPLRQSIEAELLHTETLTAGSLARRSSTAKNLANYRNQQQKLEQLTAEHDDLQRQVKAAAENYALYQKKQEDSRIADAMDQQKILNVSIVERATPPPLPSERHRALILLLGLTVTAFACVGTAMVAEYFDRPIRSAAEVMTFTRLPVLALISRGGTGCSYSISD